MRHGAGFLVEPYAIGVNPTESEPSEIVYLFHLSDSRPVQRPTLAQFFYPRVFKRLLTWGGAERFFYPAR
jgi:hypothetical protein